MLTPAICLKRGKTRVTKVLLILVLSLIGWENAANFLDQPYNEVKQIHNNPDNFRQQIRDFL